MKVCESCGQEIPKIKCKECGQEIPLEYCPLLKTDCMKGG